ncbi:MAG: ABC transporter substrate-binding protein [Candidatus Limnocylindrales bacterium]
MTDIVASTEHAAELGDSAWRSLVQRHHALVRAALRRNGGREIDTAGDGFFATFDAPAAAVRCALEVVTSVEQLGIEVRAGLHVGEVERVGAKVGGIAVPIAARIMAAAGPGEVLVSSTVRDLAAGSGLVFEDRGSRELKGVPGDWHMYATTRPNVAPATATPTEAAGEREWAQRRAAAVRHARSRPIWQRHPRLATAAVLGLALVLATAGLLVWKPWQPPALAAIADNSVGVIDTARAQIIVSIKVDERPGGIAIGDGAAWVTNTGADTVSQIDLGTRTAIRVIEVGRGPVGIAAAGGSIWVADSAGRTVTRINAATARVVDTIIVGNGPTALAAGPGSVWVANVSDSTVVRIDVATGIAGQPVPVAAAPVAIAADESGVWVVSADGAAVSHLDGVSGVTLAPPITLSSRPTAIAIGAGSVWVASGDGSVTRIDPQTNRVTATIDVGGSLSGIAATQDAVWVADRQGYVYQLEAANPFTVATRIQTTSAPEALVVADRDVWIAARASAASHRGGTLRIVFFLVPDSDPGLFPLNNLSQLEADGLVAYRRVGGTAGTALLPDLATAIPKPTNGGLTYTFQLRPNLVYSTGETVRPSDFRRAIERSFQVGDLLTDEAQGNAYFTAISGADACIAPDLTAVERCDLSAGVVADDAANTITFNLSQPDSDFLYKLAVPAAYPVPDGVPMNAPVEGAFPGTGPYVVSARSETEIRLTRNPNFRIWDAEVRPDGFPDEIIWTAVSDPQEQAAMIERGDADYMPLRLGNDLPPELFNRLRSQLTGQLRFASNSVTAITMNTALPPFDTLEARQALNMAIDRAHVAELHGGALAVNVTCQVLPPGWPGYQPFCPYTTHPDPGGRWQAPDLSAADRLVEASGTLGAKVVVGPVRARQSDTRDYLVTVLDELGYDASADPDTNDDYVFKATFEENRVQLGIWENFAGILAPSEFMLGFTCGQNDGTVNLCDPAYDTLATQASELQTTDAAAAATKWAEADRWVIDHALWAPLYNEGTDFISARVGNYQFHPAYQVLLDQLWVQ